MAREVDYNDPASWDDEDKIWLRDRIERVPAEHRHHLVENPPTAPSFEAVSPEMERLRLFLETHYAEDMAVEGQTPVGLAIQLLSDAAGVDPDAIEDGDDEDNTSYDKWKAAELTEEIGKRRQAGREIPKVSNKTEAAAALHADDATNGKFTA
jgi:hypothetical protein